jgi:CubicO group peptidase (beta-lactamase class C family)
MQSEIRSKARPLVKLSGLVTWLISIWVGCIGYGAVRGESVPEGLDRLISTCHSNNLFNGVCLLAQGDQVIFRRAVGVRTLDNAPNKAGTAIELASVTKPITASAILLLVKEGRLTLTQNVSDLISDWPYAGVTVQQLLTHTAGLPDYRPLFASDWVPTRTVANTNLLERLTQVKPPGQFPPGESWSYSNTGYAILATIIERVSGQSYARFLKERLFNPLGLSRSGVWPERAEDMAAGYLLTRRGYRAWWIDRHLDGIVGDGGVYSTADDLFQFSRAFFSGRLLGDALTKSALTPVRFKNGSFQFRGVGSGLGWYLKFEGENPTPLQAFHTGNYGGFRTLLWHDLRRDWTLVLMDNFSHSLDDISAAVRCLMDGQPWEFPKRSVPGTLLLAMQKNGIDGALQTYGQIKTAATSDYSLNERDLNTLGYVLLRDDAMVEAIAVFKLNTQEYPNSFNAFDSLAEAYTQKGDLLEAIRCYEQAVKLNPNYKPGFEMIERLRRRLHETETSPATRPAAQ